MERINEKVWETSSQGQLIISVQKIVFSPHKCSSPNTTMTKEHHQLTASCTAHTEDGACNQVM